MLYIALDTNLIRKQSSQISNIMDFCFSSFVSTELPSFIRQLSQNASICIAIPEVCLEEYIKQRSEDYNDCIKKYTETANRLKLAYPISVPGFLSAETYAKQLRSDAIAYCADNKITIIQCMDFVDWNSMFRNSIAKQLPFNKDGNSPFKDAMIYESCLGFAKTHTCDQIVLITNNSKDFKQLDSIHHQSNLRIIGGTEGTSAFEAIIKSMGDFGIDIAMNFLASAEVFVQSDDIQVKIQSAFHSQILPMDAFSSPLIEQDDNGKYGFAYNTDEENEQVEIIANIIDSDDGQYSLHLFFNKDNGGYLFKQCGIHIENEQGEELLDA